MFRISLVDLISGIIQIKTMYGFEGIGKLLILMYFLWVFGSIISAKNITEIFYSTKIKFNKDLFTVLVFFGVLGMVMLLFHFFHLAAAIPLFVSCALMTGIFTFFKLKESKLDFWETLYPTFSRTSQIIIALGIITITTVLFVGIVLTILWI